VTTYSAAFSFIGATKRIIGYFGFGKPRQTHGPLVEPVRWAGVSVTLLLAWVLVLAWYVIAFGLLGWFVVPWRMVRRNHRRQRHLQEQQLDALRGLNR
jgi:Flp pilus assembly protein TadB